MRRCKAHRLRYAYYRHIGRAQQLAGAVKTVLGDVLLERRIVIALENIAKVIDRYALIFRNVRGGEIYIKKIILHEFFYPVYHVYLLLLPVLKAQLGDAHEKRGKEGFQIVKAGKGFGAYVVICAAVNVAPDKIAHCGDCAVQLPEMRMERGAKVPLLIISYISLFVIVIMPLAMIILVGFLKAYGLPLAFENFTLDNYKDVLFNNTMVMDSIKNSIFLAFSAGIICMFLGVMVAYVIVKIKPRGSMLLELLSLLPYAIPGIVMAIGVILTWSGRFGVNLYNTIWIILVAYLARYLSFSMKSASASLQQVHPSLEEASRSCGASHFESLKDITIPLIRPAMVSGFFLIFLPAMRELTTSVLLYGPYTRTLGVAIFSLRNDGYITTASALAAIAIVLIIVLNTIVNAVLKDRKKA